MTKSNFFTFDVKKLFYLTKNLSEYFSLFREYNAVDLNFPSHENFCNKKYIELKELKELKRDQIEKENRKTIKKIKRGEYSFSTIVFIEYINYHFFNKSLLKNFFEKEYNHVWNFHEDYEKEEKFLNYEKDWEKYISFVNEKKLYLKNRKMDETPYFLHFYRKILPKSIKTPFSKLTTRNIHYFIKSLQCFFVVSKIETQKNEIVKYSFSSKQMPSLQKNKNIKVKVLFSIVFEASLSVYNNYTKSFTKNLILQCVVGDGKNLYRFRINSVDVFDFLKAKKQPRYKKYKFYANPNFNIFPVGTELDVSISKENYTLNYRDPYYNLNMNVNALKNVVIKKVVHPLMGEIY